MSTAINFEDSRFLRPIKQLDRVLINKIAAGEVIERPASVIKELVENSFDAGATVVDIVARKAGTTFMSVTDNGCGIPIAQIKLAFSRHATSKIENLDELFAVNSYGFRGEALPSIASISHLTLTTRYFSEKEGSRITIEGGRQIELKPAAAPTGTKIEVSHLFFNTPARRKFLKAETTESRHIIRVSERMALSRPSCAVTLNLNERQIFRLRNDQPVEERMGQLFGVDPGQIVEYDVELTGVSFLVYLAHPDQARQDRTRICLFINGRSVTSSSIIHAVTSGYGEFLPAGRYPLASIYLTVDPNRLDVNVHPTKAEVRLSEERSIHDNLYRIVQKALRDWKMVPARTQISSGGLYRQSSDPQTLKQSPKPGQATRESEASFKLGNRSSIPFGLRQFDRSDKELAEIYAGCENTHPIKETVQEKTPAWDSLSPDQIEYLGKSGRTYLIVTIGGELFVVDQHAAHERILYEDALEHVQQGSAVAQELLFSENIEISAEEYMTFEESREILKKLGFEVEPFGHNAVIVNAMPPVFKDKNPSRILIKILDDITHLNKAGGDLIKSVAQSLACRAAVMAGDTLNESEVKSLITRLFKKKNPYCCPHGRPTFIKISQEELDGRFGRS